MTRYHKVIRVLFALIFVGGGITHFILGRLQPDGYAVFADTSFIPQLGALWTSFVMPNIGLVTIGLGIFEVACGLGLLGERTFRFTAWILVIFLVAVTILGYGFPADSVGEDFLKNRLATIIMLILIFPLVTMSKKSASRRR